MDRGTTLLSCRVDAPAGLDSAYDMYAVGLYDYCLWRLADNRLAEDAVHNALLAAAGRGLLPAHADGGDTAVAADGEPLRAWIYATARNECLRLAPFNRRQPHPGQQGGQSGGTRFRADGSGWQDPFHQPSRAELWQLARLRRALDKLTPSDQEIAELAFRHGFGSAALAPVLGQPLARIRRAVARIYASLAADCDGVAATFAVPPFAPPPASLRRLVLEAASAPARLRHLAERQGPYNRLGFPRPRDRRHRLRPAAAIAVGACAAVLLTAGVIAGKPAIGPLGASAHRSRPAGTTPAPAEAPESETLGDLDPAAVPGLPPTPAAPPVPSAAAVKPSPHRDRGAQRLPRGLATEIRFMYDLRTRGWDAVVTTTVRGATARTVTIALWWDDAKGRHQRERTAVRTGEGEYTAEVHGLPYGPVACAQATVVAVDGATMTSPVASPGGYAYCGSSRLGEDRHHGTRRRGGPDGNPTSPDSQPDGSARQSHER